MKLLPEVAITPNSIHHMDLFGLCNAMPSESVDMILCDLPYGTTACKWDTIIPIEPMWAQFKRIIKPRGAIVLTASQPFTSRLVSSNYEMFQYDWSWQKNIKTNFLNANIMPLKQHEDVLIFGYVKPCYFPQMIQSNGHKSGARHKRNGYNYGDLGVKEMVRTSYFPSTILNISRDTDASTTYTQNPYKVERHPTQKPLALFEYLIKTYTLPGQLVFDPCVGSGTTALAAQNTDRQYICGDFTRDYVEMARKRVQNSDPYQPSIQKNGMKQLSLFA